MIVTDYFYDRFIDLDITYTDASTFSSEDSKTISEYHQRALAGELSDAERAKHQKHLKITCPRSGRKPKIEFEYSRVDGNVCYSVKLAITNLCLAFNAAYADSIEVVCGYAGTGAEHKDSFNCQVFAAYTPQPGPDGYTVFQCIIAKASNFTNIGYNFWLFNATTKTEPDMKDESGKAFPAQTSKGKWTLRAVLTRACSIIGFNCKLYMQDSLKDTAFSIQDIPPANFGNPLAVIGYLQRKLNDIGNSYEKVEDRFQIAVIVFDTTVYFIGVSPTNEVVLNTNPSKLESAALVPKLDLVSSVDWNAGSLSVVAPYNPNIKPATLFKISPSVYNGANGLPNPVVRDKLQKDPWDLYYVITQQVKFSTVGTDNSMSLMAVPFRYSPLNDQNMDSTKSSEAETGMPDNDTLKQRYQLAHQIYKDIAFGSKDAEVQSAEEEVTDINKLSIEFAQTYDYVIQKTDTGGISMIASTLALPPLKTLEHTGADIPGSQAWYPLILLATYSKYKQTNDARYKIDIQKPDVIIPGRYLVIPSLSWKLVQQQYKTKVINICTSCYEYYLKDPTTGSWAAQAKNVAVRLDKETIVE